MSDYTRLDISSLKALDEIQAIDSWVIGVAVAAMAFMATFYCFGVDKGKKNYAPMAPTSIFEVIQEMSGSDCPGFIVRTARSMGTSVYRLPMHFLPGHAFTVVGDAKLGREIMSDKATTKPRFIYATFDFVANGVQSFFSTNGPFWHTRRKGIAQGFSSKHIQRMNVVALAKCDEWIEQRLKPLIDEGKSFNVGEEMIGLLLCAITETAFEYTLSPAEVDMFKHEMPIALQECVSKSIFMPWRQAFGWMIPEVRRARVAARRIQGLSYKIIEEYKKKKKPTQGTIIDLIMHNEAYKSDEERTADITILLLAGHDTTAYSLAFTLKELAMNPGLQEELRQSIMQDTLKAPHQLESVRNTIKESLRLHPVSGAGTFRCVARDFATKDGKLIPAGSVALMSYITMMRDPAVFGEDSDQFNPTRWETATYDMNQAFIPYSFGHRNCPGQSLANAELYCILPRIISQFELTIEQPGHSEFFVTLKPVETMLHARPL